MGTARTCEIIGLQVEVLQFLQTAERRTKLIQLACTQASMSPPPPPLVRRSTRTLARTRQAVAAEVKLDHVPVLHVDAMTLVQAVRARSIVQNFPLFLAYP